MEAGTVVEITETEGDEGGAVADAEGVEMVRRMPAEITSEAVATALYRAAPPRGPSIELSTGLLLLCRGAP